MHGLFRGLWVHSCFVVRRKCMCSRTRPEAMARFCLAARLARVPCRMHRDTPSNTNCTRRPSEAMPSRDRETSQRAIETSNPAGKHWRLNLNYVQLSRCFYRSKLSTQNCFLSPFYEGIAHEMHIRSAAERSGQDTWPASQTNPAYTVPPPRSAPLALRLYILS